MKKNLTLISLMLGVMLILMVSSVSATCPQGGCQTCYGVYAKTYESDYMTEKDTFNQGDTVYAWGMDGYNNNVRLKFYYPNGSVAKTCSDNMGPTTTCSLSLASNAPTGTWKVRLQWYSSGSWHDGDCKEFTVNEVVEPECQVIVDFPSEGVYLDPVTIVWHYEGDCNPYEYNLRYQEGTCDGEVWDEIVSGLTPSGINNNTHDWNVASMISGEYCVAANMDQLSGPDVGGVSGVWYLDLTPPEADYNIYSGNSVACETGESCDYYINTDTKIQITCDEISNEDWQSQDPYTLYYRWRVDGGVWTDWNVEVSNSDPGMGTPFSFPTDSEHEIEYFCSDEVGKNSTTKSAILIVDSKAPTLSKTIGEPKVCEGSNCTYYVTQSTDICLTAVDGDPHPVGGEEIWCEYWWADDYFPSEGQFEGYSGVFELTLEENTGCFNFGQDSRHSVHCWAQDALGNEVELTEHDIVDSVAPNTWLSFEGPYYDNGTAQWIDTVSRVVLESEDLPEVHPVGVDKTYYRYGIVDDMYCYGGPFEIFPTLTSGWEEYSEPFPIEESCHMIEYYSIDKLGNKEDIKMTFVFSDHTAPTLLDIEVGKPGYKCSTLYKTLGYCEDDWDWKITMDTPVTLSCEDQGNHPSGVANLWYRVIWDGDEESAEWMNSNGESSVTLKFGEQSEHLVEYYCVDNVNKTSDTESYLFKVDGYAFDIELGNKWSLISIPFNLLVNNVTEIFDEESENIEGIWTYDESGWHVYTPNGPKDFEQMYPGKGYWVKTSQSATITVGGSEETLPESSTQEVVVYSGWNLVGHYGLGSKYASCTFGSIPWGALEGFNSTTQQRYIAAYPWDPWSGYTEPGQGYWLGVDGAVGDSYVYYSRTCPVVI